MLLQVENGNNLKFPLPEGMATSIGLGALMASQGTNNNAVITVKAVRHFLRIVVFLLHCLVGV